MFQSNKINPNKEINLDMLRAVLVVLFLWMPTLSLAAFEQESLLDVDIEAPVLDVTTDTTDNMVFVLTPGEILIFSTGERSVLDRIPVDKDFDRITYDKDGQLVLTARDPSKLSIVRVSRVHQIDLSGRPFKGQADAKVTLVVFDDYQ
jgi:hypothetical protein